MEKDNEATNLKYVVECMLINLALATWTSVFKQDGDHNKIWKFQSQCIQSNAICDQYL